MLYNRQRVVGLCELHLYDIIYIFFSVPVFVKESELCLILNVRSSFIQSDGSQ